MTSRRILGALLLLLIPAGAEAGNGTCTVSASGLDFGTFSLSELTSVGSIIVTCQGNGTFSYMLSASTGGSGSYAPRQMTGPPDGMLAYNLYLDPAFTQIFGDGTGGSSLFKGKVQISGGSMASQNVSVYGQVPAQSTPAPGQYSDTLVLTISF
jgi:spore coat protein U-like protein